MEKRWYSTSSRYFVLIICMMVVAACATTQQSFIKRAEQAAFASRSIYETLAIQVVDEIEIIVTKHREGTITEEDKKRLNTLNELKKLLDKYASTHNLFVQSLKTWETTKKEPEDTAMLENQLLRLINMGMDLAMDLNLKVPERQRKEEE
jgi:DNA-binding transcriptional regulator YiaG